MVPIAPLEILNIQHWKVLTNVTPTSQKLSPCKEKQKTKPQDNRWFPRSIKARLEAPTSTSINFSYPCITFIDPLNYFRYIEFQIFMS